MLLELIFYWIDKNLLYDKTSSEESLTSGSLSEALPYLWDEFNTVASQEDLRTNPEAIRMYKWLCELEKLNRKYIKKLRKICYAPIKLD